MTGLLLEQPLFFQHVLELVGIETDELAITDHDHRYGLSAELEKLLLHLAGFGDIEIEKRNLIPLQPALEMLTVGTPEGGVDDDTGRFLFELLLLHFKRVLIWQLTASV